MRLGDKISKGQAGDVCGGLTSHRESFSSLGSQPHTRAFHLGWTYGEDKQIQAQGLQEINEPKGTSFLPWLPWSQSGERGGACPSLAFVVRERYTPFAFCSC